MSCPRAVPRLSGILWIVLVNGHLTTSPFCVFSSAANCGFTLRRPAGDAATGARVAQYAPSAIVFFLVYVLYIFLSLILLLNLLIAMMGNTFAVVQEQAVREEHREDTLARRLTPSALRRQKMGFSVPLREWCRGAIGDAVEGALGALSHGSRRERFQ